MKILNRPYTSDAGEVIADILKEHDLYLANMTLLSKVKNDETWQDNESKKIITITIYSTYVTVRIGVKYESDR